MKKINAIIFLFIILFVIFTCSEPSENNSFSSKSLKTEETEAIEEIGDQRQEVTYTKEFTTPGTHDWQTPNNIVGNITVTLVGGGGGGTSSESVLYNYLNNIIGGGGGGAGQIIEKNIEVTGLDLIKVIVGNGGNSNHFLIGGDDGGFSQIIINNDDNKTYTALGGSGAVYDEGGYGYPDGTDGAYYVGGNGGDNGRGHGVGGISDPDDFEGQRCKGSDAPANSGGGGGGGGFYVWPYIVEDTVHNVHAEPGGAGGSGYVRIEYTVLE